MFPIPRAKIGGPSVAAQYGDDDVSDRGLDDISLREDDLHSVNLGSEAIPGSRPAWISMLEKTDFQKLHLDPFAKKGGQSVKSSMYGTKASTFSPMYDARHMFQTHASLASYSVDGDLKQPWDSSSISAKHRGRNTILIVLGASALLFLVAAITAGALYAVVEDAQSSPVANRSQGEEGAVFSSTTPNIEMNTSSTEITTTTSQTSSTTPEPTTTEQPATTEPPTTTPKPTSTASPTTTLPPITTRTSPTPPPPSPTTTLPPTTRTSPPPSPTTTVEVTLPPPTTQEPTTVAPTTTVTTTPMPTTTTTTTTTVEETSTEMTTTSPTTTTPAPTTTPEPQYIFITVGRGLLHTPTSITCLWTRDQDYGVIVLEAVATDLDVQTTMVAFKDDGQHGSFYPELFESSVRERPEGHLLTTTIKNTSCADGSSNLLYRCSVKDNPQQRDDSPLFLEVPADVSMTSLPPRYVLENTQTTLTCQATIESGGDVSLTRRGQTGSGFVRMPSLSSDANILIEGGCYTVVSRTFIVTMEMALNGSHLRCESEKPQGSSGEYLILVIPESICTASSSQKVPHPYEPSLYVECSDLEPRLTVRTCSPSFVFDEKELKCVDPYVASVTFISGNFLEGSDLELVCSMTKGNYSYVKLLKTDVASSREILLVTFTSDGRDLVEAVFSRAATASREILPAPVTGFEFKLTLGGAVCSDEGEYFCRHDNGQTSSGLVDIKIPASPMEITLSDDIIEAQPAKVTCTGTIDDMGAIILSSFDDAADSFVETSLFTQTSTQVNSGDVCKSSVTSQFSATLTFSRNGTKTRCETTSPVSTSSTREIVILPVSVCDQKSPGSVVAHPYNTVKYVTCGTPITVELCEAGLVWRQELEKCVDPGAAEVTMLDASANEGERLEITCSLTPGSYAVIGVYRRAGDTEQPMVDFYRNGTDAILSQRVTSTVRRLVGSATHMVTSLDQVSCAVAGLYVCRHDNEQEDSGEVTVFALPSSSSEVLVPTVQVGGTQGTVRCSSIVVDKANNGRVILETAASADGPFTSSELDPPSSVTKSEDQCEITADLDFTIPNLDFATWNGTYVRCRTDFPTMTTQPVMMLLIDPSVCSQAPDGTTLGNPYQPDGYLECTGNLPQLRFCQDGKLWRQDLRNCALMTDATVSMSDTPRARVGDAVNITCQVTSGTFETVRLYQDKDGSKVPLVTFLPDGTSTKESQRISEVYRERNQDGGESMTSQLEVVSCDDEGVFWCEHDNTQSGQGYLDVDVPPLVTLTPDADFTPITKNTIICVANIDLRRSGVNIELKRRDPVSGDFVDAGVTTVDTAVLEERPGCFRRERTRFSQVFDLSWNNTDFRCDVAAPESSSSVSNVLVIPGDICVNEPIASLLAHPYTEFRYIMCFLDQYAVMPCPGEGYVYIPDVQECVLHGQTGLWRDWGGAECVLHGQTGLWRDWGGAECVLHGQTGLWRDWGGAECVLHGQTGLWRDWGGAECVLHGQTGLWRDWGGAECVLHGQTGLWRDWGGAECVLHGQTGLWRDWGGAECVLHGQTGLWRDWGRGGVCAAWADRSVARLGRGGVCAAWADRSVARLGRGGVCAAWADRSVARLGRGGVCAAWADRSVARLGRGGAAELHFAAIKAPTTFTDLEDLSLECLITSGNFQNVKLLKADGTTNTPLATLNSDLTTEVLESRDIQVDASFVDSFNVRHFRVTVKAASCGDDGQYICSLNDDQERAAIVDIVVPASPPSLSLPEDMISNLENNITCGSREVPSAQVTLQLQRFDPAQNLWQDSQIASVHTRLQDGLVGESRCRSKTEFEGVYDLTWNNTQLRCALKDTDLASDPQTLYIISEDHCTAYPMASTQTHPYNRNKYFYCFGQDISIFSCPDESLVWSQNLQNCVDPSDPDIAKSTIVRESVETTRNVAPVSSIQPETTTNPTTTVRPDPEITVNGGNLTLGSAASVSCDISYPMRGSVIMVLISDTGFDVMATFDMDTADGSKDTTTKNGLTLSRSQEGQVTTLTLTFRAFACSQAGVYVCSDDGGHTGSATVKAVVADQQLVFLPPSSMTPSEAVSFQCSGVVDKTGRLYFAVKSQDDPDTEFKELDLPGIEHQALELDSCTSVKSILVTSTFDLSYQGRHIRCEASTQEQGSESFQITFS
ncbi:hypothetical protein RRG08_012007 [Elysia crispata]|uniref:Uncharacterized protein n=1 Tax=Elysia crispata TaxID=231223 RepID=A0AAE0ZGU5_9GAST|nr:hypothetical protein RRG08_012007 [Elysia crispata]